MRLGTPGWEAEKLHFEQVSPCTNGATSSDGQEWCVLFCWAVEAVMCLPCDPKSMAGQVHPRGDDRVVSLLKG